MASAHITFPVNQQAAAATARAFFDIAGIPQVLGVIDCTHVRIRRPREDAAAFVNRKGFHSINVQAVCDARLQFTNIVARWPGCSHDAFIFRQSALNDLLANGRVAGYLLGDAGYPLRPYLLTPFRSPQTNAERNFNRRLSRTRATIERAFGILKSRFRCLDASGGALQFHPSKVCSIILACCVLHNYAVSRAVPLPPEAAPIVDVDEVADEAQIGGDNAAGRAERQRVMQLLPAA
jgi:hypothetical protein